MPQVIELTYPTVDVSNLHRPILPDANNHAGNQMVMHGFYNIDRRF